MKNTMRLVASTLTLLAAACGSGSSTDSGGQAATAGADTKDVLLVANSVAGTITVLDGHTYDPLGSIDIIPDIKDRLGEMSLIRSGEYAVVKHGQLIEHFEPHDGDRFVDDVFLSPDGKTLYVSRSNLGDVAAFDLTKADHPMLWRTAVDGVKADHATISPDGSRLVVSVNSLLNPKAQVFDAKTGEVVGSFPTGAFPHQNDYSADGKHIYNGSIGNVALPPIADLAKGKRQLTVVDANTFEVVRTYDFDRGIRPAVITPDESYMYTQLSHLNGLVKFNLKTGEIEATLDEPKSEAALQTYSFAKDPDEHALSCDLPHDSMHHGIAMSGDGKKLCDCGTIDENVNIVSTDTMQVLSTVDVGDGPGAVPYWATTSVDGKSCIVSLSGKASVVVIDYETGRVQKQVPVGIFPQRNRLGRISTEAKLDQGVGARNVDDVLPK